MLIHDVVKRKEATATKLFLMLNFLKEETYSDFTILRKVLGFSPNAHSPLYKVLNRAVNERLLIKHEIPNLKRKLTIWGITLQGLVKVVYLKIKPFLIILNRQN